MKPQRELSLPNNYDAERALLGAAIQNTEMLTKAADIVHASDFFDDRHQAIFGALLKMRELGQPSDSVTVAEFMGKNRTLGNGGGVVYISHLLDGCPSIVNAEHYAKIVKEKARLRTLIRRAADIQTAAAEPTAQIEDLEKTLLATTNGHHTSNGNSHGIKFKSYSLLEFMQATFPPKEHLIEGIIPRSTPGMVIALPHRLKSWFTTGIALGATNECLLMGKLAVNKPVRTYLAQLEDWPGELQARLGSLLRTGQFTNCNHENVRILPRCDLDLTQKESFDFMAAELRDFKPDLVILDVLRKFFSGDVNSPKETAAFLKRVDELADLCQASIFLVHHENRKKEEIMLAAAGSYNWAGWAQVMIQFSRKTETRTPEGPITSVEIEVDNKLAPSPEPMRLTLNTSSSMPLILEAVEDGTGFNDAMEQLGDEWDINALSDVLGCHRSSANRRVKKWIEQGKVEKIKSGKRGRGRTMAMYRSLTEEETSTAE